MTMFSGKSSASPWRGAWAAWCICVQQRLKGHKFRCHCWQKVRDTAFMHYETTIAFSVKLNTDNIISSSAVYTHFVVLTTFSTEANKIWNGRIADGGSERLWNVAELLPDYRRNISKGSLSSILLLPVTPWRQNSVHHRVHEKPEAGP
jgi:hypothetical protein